MRKWTSEQIMALAPDANSIKAAKDLATTRKWGNLGSDQQSIWGECQGSGKNPYQTRIDLNTPAFKCSCPSRKFPCKHALALFLLLAEQSKSFTQTNPPDWVTDWLTKREQTSSKQTEKKKDKPVNEAAQAKRAKQREDRVEKGISDLSLWLSDLLRNGLDHIQSQSISFWETPASNMVNAQAPGLARKLRDMASIPGSGQDWQEHLLFEIGKLHLILEGYKNISQLPQNTIDDIRTQIGFTQSQEELLVEDGVTDHWIVLGKRTEDELLGALNKASFMKVQRTWLWGIQTGRLALLLQFAAPGQTLDVSLISGVGVEAELVFFPSAYPLRALVKKQNSGFSQEYSIPGYTTISESHQAYTDAITINPWIETFPLSLKEVIPSEINEQWGLQDEQGHWLPIAKNYPQTWTLLALSGGYPIHVFSEWNGRTLFPLSVVVNGRYIPLHTVAEAGTSS
jgi:hypothetical protein